MAWQNDSVPDGIEDDPSFNDDVARSRRGETRVIIDKWGSQHFFLHPFCYIFLRTVKRSNHQTT